MPPSPGAQSIGTERGDGTTSSSPTNEPRPAAGDDRKPTSGALASSASRQFLDPATSRQQSILHTSRGSSASPDNQRFAGRLGSEPVGASLIVRVGPPNLALVALPPHQERQPGRRLLQAHPDNSNTSAGGREVDHQRHADSPDQQDLCHTGRDAGASRQHPCASHKSTRRRRVSPSTHRASNTVPGRRDALCAVFWAIP